MKIWSMYVVSSPQMLPWQIFKDTSSAKIRRRMIVIIKGSHFRWHAHYHLAINAIMVD